MNHIINNHKDFGYREIRVDDLPLEPIEDDDRQAIEKERNARNNSLYIFIVVGFLPLLALLTNADVVAKLACVGFSALFVGCAWFGTVSDSNKVAHSKYGVIADRRTVISTHSRNGHIYHERDTYFDVAFPDDGTIIYDIDCSADEYECSHEGQRILVYSFAERHEGLAFGILKQDDTTVDMHTDKQTDYTNEQANQSITYRTILQDEIVHDDIRSEDMNAVNEVRRRINIGQFSSLAFFILFFMFWMLITVALIVSSDKNGDTIKAIACLLIIDAFIAFTLILKFRKLILPFRYKISCAQYGTVINRHSAKDVQDGNITNATTFDVIFPETGTVIYNVRCMDKDYNKSENGKKVLVFAFEGASCICCTLQRPVNTVIDFTVFFVFFKNNASL